MALPASDAFNRAGPGLGANWTTISGESDPQIVSSTVVQTFQINADSAARWTADTWPDDQYAEVVCVKALTDTTRFVGVALRAASAARTYFRVGIEGPLGSSATVVITKFNGGTFTSLQTGTYTVNANDTFRAQIVGTTIRTYVNGVDTGITATDSTIATGSAGASIFVDGGTGGVETDAQLDNFAGGAVIPEIAPLLDIPVRRRLASVALLTWTLSLLQTTLAPSAAKPFHQDEWPVPSAPRAAIALGTFINPVETQLIGKDQFFTTAGRGAVYDWPNPRGPAHPIDLRTFLDAVQLQLIGKDQVFGAPGQTATYDWPVPRGPAYPTSLRTWTQSLNTTTLTPVVQAPFGQPDWPTPPTPARSIDLRTWTQNLQQTTLAVLAPFAQRDWLNPRAATPVTELRTFLDGVDVQLIGKDQVFGAPGQGPAYDWPNPLGDVFPIVLRTWTQEPLPTLGPATGTPFTPDDFPNPRGPNYPISNRTFLGYYVTDDTAPFVRQDQCPVPTGPVFSIGLRTHVQNLLETTLAAPVPVPFNLVDWPVPRGATPAISLRTWTDQRELGLVDQPAFKQTDWPNPRGPLAAIELRTWLQNLSEDPLSVPIVVPGHQTDWPNPRGPIPAIDLRTFVDAVQLQLIGKDQIYGAPGQVPPQYDWPVPIAAGRSISLRTWIVSLQGSTLAPFTGPPFAQTDWPNPRAPQRAIDLWTFLEPVNIQLIGKDQFFGAPGETKVYDYPNPRGPAIPSVLKTWTDPLKIQLVGKDKFFGAAGQPPANLDWPVPKGAQRASTLHVWLQSLFLARVPPNVVADFLIRLFADNYVIQIPRDQTSLEPPADDTKVES